MIITHIPETQLEAIAAKAKAALPLAVNGRIEKACCLVRSASVEVHEDGSATVISESDGLTGYLVQHGQCTCPDFEFQAPEGWCAHRIAVAIAIWCQRQARQAPPEASGTDTTCTSSGEPDATTGTPAASTTVPAHYLVLIQGKPFVKFAGLLQMAHEQQLVELSEVWTYNDTELSLAHAVVIFEDGRRFEGSGDASPSNVTKKVAPHFRRVALTRAKSRALRDALNIDMVAVEELGEE